MNKISKNNDAASDNDEILLLRLMSQYASTAWIRILSFLTIFACANWLSGSKVWTIILTFAVFEAIAFIADAGFTNLATLKVAENDKYAPDILRQGLRFRLLASSLTIIIFLTLFFFSKSESFFTLALFCTALLPLAYVQNARAYWHGHKKIITLQTASLIAYTTGILLALIMAWFRQSAVLILTVQSLSFWFELLLVHKLCKPNPELSNYKDIFSPTSLPKSKGLLLLLSQALPFGILQIAFMLYLRLDIFLINSYDLPHPATYGIGLKIYSAILLLFNGSVIVLLADAKKIKHLSAYIRRCLKTNSLEKERDKLTDDRVNDIKKLHNSFDKTNGVSQPPVPENNSETTPKLPLPYIATITSIFLVSALLIIPEFITQLLPPAYAAIGKTLQTLLVSSFLQCLGLFCSTLYLAGKNKKKYLPPLGYLCCLTAIIILTLLQTLFFRKVFWEWNRLAIDFTFAISSTYFYLSQSAKTNAKAKLVNIPQKTETDNCVTEMMRKKTDNYSNLPFCCFLFIPMFFLLLMPLLNSTESYQKVACMTVVILLPWAIYLTKHKSWGMFVKPKWQIPDYFLMLFLTTSFASSAISSNNFVSAKFMLSFLLTGPVVYALGKIMLNTVQRLQTFCRLLGAIGILVGIIAICTLNLSERFTGIWSNPIVAAQIFLFLLPGVSLFWGSKQGWKKPASIVFGAGLLLGLAATKTFGSILSLLLCAIIWILKEHRFRIKTLPIWMITIILFLVIVTTMLYRKPDSLNKAQANFTTKTDTNTENFLTKVWKNKRNSICWRLESFLFATHIMRQQPWFGIGPRSGAFASNQGKYCEFLKSYNPSFLFAANKKKTWFFQHMQALRTLDNTYLTVLVEHGIVAGIFFTAFITSILWLAVPPQKNTYCSAKLVVIWKLSFYVFFCLCLNLMEYDLFPWYSLNCLFWVLAAFLLQTKKLSLAMDKK